MDVSHWDGVVGLPSGAEQPFYRMVPHDPDCHALLGGPRGVRYVAQENLTPLDDLEAPHTLHTLHTLHTSRTRYIRHVHVTYVTYVTYVAYVAHVTYVTHA